MKTLHALLLTGGCIAYTLFCSCQSAQTTPPPADIEPVISSVQQAPVSPNHHKMQLVFCLDATGSMAGLIAAAKEKIWSITSSIVQNDSTLDVELAFVFYRDRGDNFVTRPVPFSQEIDSLYSILMDIKAQGGGDLPESVNEALDVAVNQLLWDENDSVYKTIFLVGDCPPHMDYTDDVKYPVSCASANKKGITINTILMGNDRGAKKVWTELKDCSNGSFVQLDMNANNFEVSTPYDDSIDICQQQLDGTRIYYGGSIEKGSIKMANATKISRGSSKAVSAKRAEFYNTDKGKKVYFGEEEWVNDVKENSKLIDTISTQHIPAKFKGMTKEQIKAATAKLITERKNITEKIKHYSIMRDSCIKKELEKKSGDEVKGSFNSIVYENIKKQAADKKIILKGDAKF